MSCPSFASSSNFCSTSLATRSPPVSTPSYVKLPALRFATRMASFSSGNLSRRLVLTYLRCSGLPQSLERVSILRRHVFPEACGLRCEVWRTHGREHRDGLLWLTCEWMREETWLQCLPYRWSKQSGGAAKLKRARLPDLVRDARLYRAQHAKDAPQARRHRTALTLVRAASRMVSSPVCACVFT
jgi:hypothetical protein